MWAWGLVETRGEPVELDRVWAWGGVHPAHRGTGLGRELLAWQVDRAGAVHRATWPDVPGVAEVFARAGVDEPRAALPADGLHGAAVVARPGDAAGRSAVPDAPEGVRFVPYAEVDDDAVRRAFNEAWVDHWGSQQRDPEGWATEVVGSSVLRPDLSAVAVAGDEVVALLLSERYPQDDEVRGHAEAWIGTLGTGGGWRGRPGLASGRHPPCPSTPTGPRASTTPRPGSTLNSLTGGRRPGTGVSASPR